MCCTVKAGFDETLPLSLKLELSYTGDSVWSGGVKSLSRPTLVVKIRVYCPRCGLEPVAGLSSVLYDMDEEGAGDDSNKFHFCFYIST